MTIVRTSWPGRKNQLTIHDLRYHVRRRGKNVVVGGDLLCRVSYAPSIRTTLASGQGEC